jgi:hypothetical protein
MAAKSVERRRADPRVREVLLASEKRSHVRQGFRLRWRRPASVDRNAAPRGAIPAPVARGAARAVRLGRGAPLE